MQTNHTLWQRITAATPLFFKKLQALGIGLVAAGTSLSQVNGIPERISSALITVGTTVTIISQFAVNQLAPITDDDIK